MATLEQLERRIEQLENAVTDRIDELIAKSEKAIDLAMHQYHVDHFGFIYVWDYEAQGYRKTQMRVCTPEIPDEAVTTEKMADGAVTGNKIADGAVDTSKLANKTVKSVNIAPGAVTTEKILDQGITGDDFANNIPNGKLADNSVSTRCYQPKSVTFDKLSDEAKNYFLNMANEIKEWSQTQMERLQQLIDSFDEHNVFVANEFGDDDHVAVSQKRVTEALSQLWQKFEDLTGEVIQGINMVVTPTFFVSEDGCTIHIAANTVEANGIFEKIQFFIDNELIHEDTNTDYVSFDYHLDNKPTYTYVIMCKAKIMGIEYTRQQVITRYNEFFIGAGNTYTDILDSAHSRQLNGTMRHNYDVTFGEGDKLIIVMGATLRDGFIRADLNGVEIELTEQTVTIDDKQYVVLTSEPWSEGDYNIDING